MESCLLLVYATIGGTFSAFFPGQIQHEAELMDVKGIAYSVAAVSIVKPKAFVHRRQFPNWGLLREPFIMADSPSQPWELQIPDVVRTKYN